MHTAYVISKVCIRSRQRNVAAFLSMADGAVLFFLTQQGTDLPYIRFDPNKLVRTFAQSICLLSYIPHVLMKHLRICGRLVNSHRPRMHFVRRCVSSDDEVILCPEMTGFVHCGESSGVRLRSALRPVWTSFV